MQHTLTEKVLLGSVHSLSDQDPEIDQAIKIGPEFYKCFSLYFKTQVTCSRNVAKKCLLGSFYSISDHDLIVNFEVKFEHGSYVCTSFIKVYRSSPREHRL